MSTETFPTIAHCAMKLIFQHKDWSNKKIAEEVTRTMGSRTGPGNISWYKGKLKKGELKIENYNLNLDEAPLAVEDKKEEVKEEEFKIPAELIVSEDDIISATGMQKLALQFIKTRSHRDFNALYARLNPGMTHYAMNLLKDRAAADDVVSEAFGKIWKNLDQYNKYWSFSTWAYRIVHNEAMQHIRKSKMLVGLDGHDGKYNHSDSSQYGEYNVLHSKIADELSVEDPNWNLDETVDQNQETYEKVIKEINNLSKFYKDIMIDRELNGLKYKQIAEKYDININSVKTRIKRARLQIIENNQDFYKAVQARNKKRKIMVDDEDEFEQSISDAKNKCDLADEDMFDIF